MDAARGRSGGDGRRRLRSSSIVSSSAREAVATFTMFVMPTPARGGGRRRLASAFREASTVWSAMPARMAGQKRFPGCGAKWAFTAAVHSPGLMPTKSRSRPGPDEVVYRMTAKAFELLAR